jgi:hypothetical protein
MTPSHIKRLRRCVAAMNTANKAIEGLEKPHRAAINSLAWKTPPTGLLRLNAPDALVEGPNEMTWALASDWEAEP